MKDIVLFSIYTYYTLLSFCLLIKYLQNSYMKRLRPCLHGAKSFCIYWHRAKPATEMKRKRNRGGVWRSSGWETDMVFVLLKSAP